MSDVEIVPVDALSDDPVQRQRFSGAVAVHTAAAQAAWGDDHTGWSEAEVRGRRANPGEWTFADRLALRGGKPVAMSALAMPGRDNRSLALLMLAVDPEERRRGVGTQVLDETLDVARARGRSIVQADTEWAAEASDGSGAFAAHHGFVAGQTTVRSAMPLPADERELRAYAHGDGVEDAAAFEIEAAWGMPPEGWLSDLAVLQQRMSTDTPLGELTMEEEDWDVARVARNYTWAADVGRRALTAVARDLSTDRLVGFTVLQVPSHDPTLAYQQDTLVLREGRGNRLGLRLKAAAALDLMDVLPEVNRVRTWNADDNAHMLAVNRDLGYRPEGHLRVWERRF